jgi:hypothetical protein
MKRAKVEYVMQLEKKCARGNERMKKILEKHPEYNALGCEVITACWKDQENKRYQKKRRKKYKKNWRNYISLSDYHGKMIINQELAFDRSKCRYEEEKLLLQSFWHAQLKENEIKTICKDGRIKICFTKPQERRLEVLDCECGTQAINHLPNLDELHPAPDDDNFEYIQIHRLRQVIESTDLSEDGTNCLNSETDP